MSFDHGLNSFRKQSTIRERSITVFFCSLKHLNNKPLNKIPQRIEQITVKSLSQHNHH